MNVLAAPSDLTDLGYEVLVRDRQPEQIDRLMLRASRAVESHCSRRFMAFTITESLRAEGVDPTSIETGGWPLDLVAALGRSRAQAFGSTGLVRDVWLSEYAPLYADLWTYSNVSVTLARALGGTESILGASLEGPEPDSGHFRFSLGAYVPVGTTVRVTYTGGYTTPPEDLVQATVMQAAKLALLGAEPQTRKELSLKELNDQIESLLRPYVRS